MENHSDETLFQGLKEGSESAFKKVYEDSRELFLNFARRYSLADEEILDAYQDAYVALYENIQNGKLTTLKSSLSTYIISIGKYKIMERLRKRNRRTNNEQLLNRLKEVDIAIEEFDIDNEALSTEQKLLKKYFDTLGEKCQKILTLFYYQQYNIKEIMAVGNYNSENVETAFNDRNNFQSKKTVESVSISSSGNNVKVKMQFHTWSQNVELSNVKMTKEQFGYFITGSQSNNTKTVYYTITISHRGKII